MVVACQVKNSVEGQNLDFRRRRMSEAESVLHGHIGRNCNIAGRRAVIARSSAGRSGKREHVRGLVLAAKLAIERAQGRAAGDQHMHDVTHSGRVPRTPDETIQRLRTQTRNFLLQNDQLVSNSAARAGQRNSPDAQRPADGRLARFYCLSSLEDTLSLSMGSLSLTGADSVVFGSASSSICSSATRVLCSS